MRVVFVPGWIDMTEAAAEDEVHGIAKDVAADVRRNILADNLVLTGAMLKSVRVRKLAQGSAVYIGTDHWHFIEYGTAPHRILARPAGALRFTINGQMTFSKYVSHPGTREYAVVRRALYKKR